MFKYIPLYTVAILIALLSSGCGLMTPLPTMNPPREIVDAHDRLDFKYYFEHSTQAYGEVFQGYEIYYKWYLDGNSLLYSQDREFLEDQVIVNQVVMAQRGFLPCVLQDSTKPVAPFDANNDGFFHTELSDDKLYIKIYYQPYNTNPSYAIKNELRRAYDNSDYSFFRSIDRSEIQDYDFSSSIKNAIAPPSVISEIRLELAVIAVAYGLTTTLEGVFSRVVAPIDPLDLYEYTFEINN